MDMGLLINSGGESMMKITWNAELASSLVFVSFIFTSFAVSFHSLSSVHSTKQYMLIYFNIFRLPF